MRKSRGFHKNERIAAVMLCQQAMIDLDAAGASGDDSFVAKMALSNSARLIWKFTGRLLTCIALLGCVTYVAFLLQLHALVAGLAYLLVVLTVAANWGLLESGATSLIAMMCLAFFFLPPIFSLRISDPRDLAAFFVFMATSIIAIHLSSRARQRALEAQSREAEVERLYQLGRSLMMLDSRHVGVQIAEKVRQRFGFLCVAFCADGSERIDFAGHVDARLEPSILRDTASRDASFSRWMTTDSSGDEIVAAPVSSEGQVIASLCAVGPPISDAAWQAVANLASITVERIQTQAAASRMEAARQSESLKALLLDSLAHDFMTPLTSIKGAVTTLRSEYQHAPDEEDLLAVVEEESDKLTGMINETIDVARIESGEVQIRRQRLLVSELIDYSLTRMSSILDGTPMNVNVPQNVPAISADPDLVSLALRQLINNAIKYSPPGSGVDVAAVEEDNNVTVSVSDDGPGIPPAEIEAIFERYYRGAATQPSVAGTGMGLSIARDIILAHGGRIWAENKSRNGAQFSFTLPIADSGTRS